MRETVRRLHKGGTRGPSAKSDGLTVTEDEVQMFVRHVVLLVWVGLRVEVLDRDKRGRRDLVVTKLEV